VLAASLLCVRADLAWPSVPAAAAPLPRPVVQQTLSNGVAPHFWSVALAESLMKRYPDFSLAYLGSWTYAHGYTLCGFEMLYQATGDRRYYDFIKRYIDQHIDEHGNFRQVMDGRGRLRDTVFNNQYNMMLANTLVMLYEHTGDIRYQAAARRIRQALDDYPRNSNGGLWHSHSLPGQWWIDGIFMSQMFLIRYGKSIGDADYCFHEATRQILTYARNAERGTTGLLLHATFEPGHGGVVPRWADPKTGLSPEVWSEGLGWYTLVTVETLAALPATHPRRAELAAVFRRVCAGLKRTQDPATGGWFTVVDKLEAPGNWIDSSGTAMFVYTLQRGLELGLLDWNEYAFVVKKGYAAMTNLLKVNAEGLVDVYSASDTLAVQPSYEAYINNPKRAVNAKEAVAGVLWATTLLERPELEKFKTKVAPEPRAGVQPGKAPLSNNKTEKQP